MATRVMSSVASVSSGGGGGGLVSSVGPVAATAPLSPIQRPSAANITTSVSPAAAGSASSFDHGDDHDWANPSIQAAAPSTPPTRSAHIASNGHHGSTASSVTVATTMSITVTKAAVLGTPAASSKQSVMSVTPTMTTRVPTSVTTSVTTTTTSTVSGHGHSRSVSEISLPSTTKLEKKSIFRNLLGGIAGLGSKKSTPTTPVRQLNALTNNGTPTTMNGGNVTLTPTAPSIDDDGGSHVSTSSPSSISPFAFFKRKKGEDIIDEWLPRESVRPPPSTLIDASMSLSSTQLVTMLYPSLSTSLLWRFSLLTAALSQSTSSTTSSAASSRQSSRRPSFHNLGSTTAAGLPIMTLNGMMSPHPPLSSPPPLSASASPPALALSPSDGNVSHDGSLDVLAVGQLSPSPLSGTELSDPFTLHVPSLPFSSSYPLVPLSSASWMPGYLNSTYPVSSLLVSPSLSLNVNSIWPACGYAVPSHDTTMDVQSLRIGRVDELGNYEAYLPGDANESQRQRANKPLVKPRDTAREIIFNVGRDAEYMNRTPAIDDIRVYMDTITSLHQQASSLSLSSVHRRSSSSNSVDALPVLPSSSYSDSNIQIVITNASPSTPIFLNGMATTAYVDGL